jgi:histidinol phosphatase-like PHP family hydrolase
MLIDLHIHSNFSDGKLTIPEIVDLYVTRGFGAIAITDHVTESSTLMGLSARLFGKTLTEKTFGDYISTIKAETKRARREYGMCVIPGFEISKNYLDFKKASHILALGVEKYIYADLSCETIIDLIHEYRGFAVGAHPVYSGYHAYQTYYLWEKRKKMSAMLDAWEAANRTSFLKEVYESGYPVIASSDLHKASHLDGWKTVVTCERNWDAIFDAIKKRTLGFLYYRDHIPAQENLLLYELSELEDRIGRIAV